MAGYNDLSELQKELLRKNLIDLKGSVDKEMFNYVREAIIRGHSNGSPDLEILITSCGGECGAGLDIFDILADYNGLLTCKVFGFANSMASIIMQACDQRLCAANANILIHNPKEFRNDHESDKELSRRVKLLSDTRESMINIYLSHCKRTRKQIEAAMKRAKSLTAQEALKFGLIDEIIVPKIGKKPRGGK